MFVLAEKGDDHYFIKSGVRLRTWRDKLALTESSFHQIVVPASLHLKLLQTAHEIPAAGHPQPLLSRIFDTEYEGTLSPCTNVQSFLDAQPYR